MGGKPAADAHPEGPPPLATTKLLNAAGQSTGQPVQRPQHIPEKDFETGGTKGFNLAPRGRDNSPHVLIAEGHLVTPTPPQIPLKEGEEVC